MGSDVIARSRERRGVLLGLLGVVGFSVSLPATRVAVEDLDSTIVGLGRAVVAAALAGLVLAAVRDRPPRRALWPRLGLVALGVVFGFPLLTAVALQDVPAAHGAVVVGLLPAATAVMAVVRAGERPPRAFWAAAAAGVVAVLVFAAAQGAGRPEPADGLLLGAVALAALGYAEGAALSRELDALRVLCWSLVLSAPVLLPIVAVAVARSGLHADRAAWAGFAYVSLVSMFLAFLPWYRGLALGGVARVGQVQLLQPVLTLVWSALLLGEHVGPGTVAAALLVVACAGATQLGRAAVRRR